jgi:hypothetical protein
MGYLALARHLQGDHAQAEALCRRAIALMRQGGTRLSLESFMFLLAGALKAQGKGGAAVRLLGAADALAKTSGAPSGWLYRAAQDQLAAVVRSGVNEVAFAAASAEGRAMTWEQAIELALESGLPD